MSVHKDKKTGAWYYVVDLPRAESDERRQHKKRGFGTKAQAEKAERRFLNEVDEGRHDGTPVLTVGEFLQTLWLPRIKASVKASTLSSFEADVRLHIVPRIGDMPIATLTAIDITDLYLALQEPGADQRSGTPKGLSAKKVQNIHLTLHRALQDAVVWKKMPFNPCKGALKPKSGKPDIVVLTWDQFEDFVGWWRGDPDGPVVEFILLTGLRRGEALGLRWDDVHWTENRIYVCHSHVVVDGKVTCESPKSAYSKRWVPLAPRAVAILKEVRKAQAERHLALGLGQAEYLFTRADGSVHHPDLFTQRFSRRVRSAEWKGPRATIHGLRHTFATLSLVKYGMPVGALSRILGHSSVAFTMDVYTKWIPDDLDEAMAGWSDPSLMADTHRAASPLVGRKRGWAGITDEDIRLAVEGAGSIREVAGLLGLSAATKNYDRLRVEADRLGIALPQAKAGRKRSA